MADLSPVGGLNGTQQQGSTPATFNTTVKPFLQGAGVLDATGKVTDAYKSDVNTFMDTNRCTPATITADQAYLLAISIADKLAPTLSRESFVGKTPNTSNASINLGNNRTMEVDSDECNKLVAANILTPSNESNSAYKDYVLANDKTIQNLITQIKSDYTAAATPAAPAAAPAPAEPAASRAEAASGAEAPPAPEAPTP